jgi:signal transduction histidine kinase
MAPPPVDVLAHRLAHDIRTPMGVVAGVLDELDQAAPGSAPMILLARRSVHRLGWLARRLDWVSSAVAGNAAQDRGAAPLDELARGAVAAALQTGSRRGVTASVAPMTEASPLLPCARLWRHVYEELLVNALRHARGAVELHVAVEGAVARIAVVDDGPGMPPERPDAPFATRSDGGLGLWLAHGLAVAAGGDLRLEPGSTGARVVAECPLS